MEAFIFQGFYFFIKAYACPVGAKWEQNLKVNFLVYFSKVLEYHLNHCDLYCYTRACFKSIAMDVSKFLN
jgi:hypothetical protein